MYTRYRVFLLILPVIFILPAPRCTGKDRLPPHIKNILEFRSEKLKSCRQLLVVTADTMKSSRAAVISLEKSNEAWRSAGPLMSAVIGKKGFALPGKKKEGDLKTPSGIFQLGKAFGYAKKAATGLEYFQVDDRDYWIDDSGDKRYNSRVRGRPAGVSFEKLKRKDDLYRWAVIIRYNMDPVVKGKGSALFLHLWSGPGSYTAGCVAVSTEDMLRLLKWLDRKKQPCIVMGSKNPQGFINLQE